MAATVLDSGLFASSPANSLVAAGANLGGQGLTTSGSVSAASVNASSVNVAASSALSAPGLVRADGFFITNTIDPLCPASSANPVFFTAEPNGFVLGRNYVWTAPTPPSLVWGWTGSVGAAGQMFLTGAPGQMAFDTNSIILATPALTGVPTAAGSLTIETLSPTAVVIRSVDTVGAIVPGDVRRVGWICFNPNWAT
jgi:hypothetical protein